MADFEVSPEALLPMLKTLRASVSQTNAALTPLLNSLRKDPSSLDLAAGLSLLSVRPNLLISYTHLYALLIADRLASASQPSLSPVASSSSSSASVLDNFSAARPARSSPVLGQDKEVVEEMILIREVMERVRGMEGKVGKQVDRLVKGAVEGGQTKEALENDPLSFRPNPSALLKPSRSGNNDDSASDASDDNNGPTSSKSTSGIYRPPRLAAVPYLDSSSSRKTKSAARPPKTSTLLTDYALSTGSTLPHAESVTGLHTYSGVGGGSGKSKSLAMEQTEFEESAFVRLPLKKTDLKRREKEEREDALGLGGWGDVLGGIGGSGEYALGGTGTGGEEGGAWERRKRSGPEDEGFGGDGGGKKAKKGRFEREVGNRGKSKKRR
ncbi:hypothetical protein BDY24DRAFT_391416 [Mrakia frigida]|uniref:small subunit rRNA maturation protein LCP5 n=1 Tax=Mrakia frigida TaxID=29902 RepID=UPI003FCC215A